MNILMYQFFGNCKFQSAKVRRYTLKIQLYTFHTLNAFAESTSEGWQLDII